MNHFDQILKGEHLYPDHARLGSAHHAGRAHMGIGKSSRVRALAAAYGTGMQNSLTGALW